MELPGRRELREQILHQMDGRTSYVSDADVYREIDKAILRSISFQFLQKFFI